MKGTKPVEVKVTGANVSVKLTDDFMPVSYTHLDVYKRQAFISCSSVRCMRQRQ